MKSVYSFFTAMLLILSINCQKPQEIPAEINQVTFDQKILKSISDNDTAQVQSLIKDYRYFAPPIVGKLLSQYISALLADSTESAQEKITKAQHLAQYYKDIYNNDKLVKRVSIYRGWSSKDRNIKVKADSLLNAGIQSAIKGELQKAIDIWQQCLHKCRQINDEHAIAHCSKNIGQAYRYLGNYEQAINTLNSAIVLSQNVENQHLQGVCLREIGVVYHIMGHLEESLNYWKEALAIFQLLKNKEDETITTTHLGVYYKSIGKPYQALEYYNKAALLADECQYWSEKANCLNNMANIYMDFLADYNEAITLFKQALEIKKDRNELLHQATISGNIGICYRNMGYFARAYTHLTEAEKIATELHNKPAIGKISLDIGTIYTEAGEYEQAIYYYNKALAIFETVKHSLAEIDAMINLASTCNKFGDPQKAEELFTKALQKAQEASSQVKQTSILTNLGILAVNRNNYNLAEKRLNEALHSSREVKDIRQEMRLYQTFGDFYFKCNDLAKAKDNFEQSLYIAKKIDSPTLLWEAFYGMAKVYEKRGELEKAVACCDSSITHIESLRASFKAISLQVTFTSEIFDVYETIIFLLFKLGKEEKAFEYLERSKNRGLLEILSRDKINIKKGISPAYLKKKEKLEYEISRIQNELEKIYSTNSASIEFENYQDSLNIFRSNYNRLLDEIEIRFPVYSQLLAKQPQFDLNSLKKILPSGTTLIEYLVGKDSTIVWMINKQLTKSKVIAIDKDSIDVMVTKLLQPFKEIREGKIRNLADVQFDLLLAQRIYATIFGPLANYLENERHLIIVPDAALYYLPFEALVLGLNKVDINYQILFNKYKRPKYLVEKYQISYAPSASVLLSQWEKSKDNKKGQLLAFGNPDFGQVKKEKDTNVNPFVLKSGQGFIFTPLPKSEIEVKEICKILTPSAYYLQSEASETNFKQFSPVYTYLHLSTHCVIEESQPLYSKIVLAQNSDHEDGFLHTFEVFDLQLDADLVTLSACETGLGMYNRGEGINGLSRAFFFAGTSSLLVSLWSVDEYSSELMIPFYQKIKEGKTKSAALREAKLELINKQKDNISFSHPFLWAPFILIGCWE